MERCTWPAFDEHGQRRVTCLRHWRKARVAPPHTHTQLFFEERDCVAPVHAHTCCVFFFIHIVIHSFTCRCCQKERTISLKIRYVKVYRTLSVQLLYSVCILFFAEAETTQPKQQQQHNQNNTHTHAHTHARASHARRRDQSTGQCSRDVRAATLDGANRGGPLSSVTRTSPPPPPSPPFRKLAEANRFFCQKQRRGFTRKRQCDQ